MQLFARTGLLVNVAAFTLNRKKNTSFARIVSGRAQKRMLIIPIVLNNIVINVRSGARSNFFKQGQKAAKK